MNKQEIQSLVDRLNYLTKKYDEGIPEVSDKEWDNLYFQLVDAEKESGIILPDSPTQKVSYTIVSSLPKITHNHKMLSLDKTKDINEIISFLNKNDYVAMAKMDGLTCSLRYLNGGLVSAETRGNGLVGEDITHNAMTISSIPKKINHQEELIIDGEVVCLYPDFQDFEKDYKNPRNFAAGSIRLLDANECARRKLTFIAWDVIKGFDDETLFLNKLIKLESLGFKIVPWVQENENYAISDIQDWCLEQGYPIDGIVFKFNDIAYGKAQGETAHHFKNAIAYKFYDEKYETSLINIEWSMGRTGQLTPIAIFNPVDIDDTEISRASLHNINIMESLLKKPFKNQIINIYKSNQIIPQVFGYTGDIPAAADFFQIPELCPYCNQPTTITESDSGTKELYCYNPECNGKLINKIEHFFGKKGLDVKGISLATFEKLINLNWVNEIADIYNLYKYKEQWIQLPGFGEKSVNKILLSIENSKNCDLDKFICAIGIPLIGTVASKQIAQYFKIWDKFKQAINNRFDFSVLYDFGYIMSEAILNFNYTEADKLSKILNILEYSENTNEINNKLTGKKIVITGTLNQYKNREELKTIIESNGGKVLSSISSNVDILINNNINSTSAKNIAAKKLNIPIITELQFIEEFID